MTWTGNHKVTLTTTMIPLLAAFYLIERHTRFWDGAARAAVLPAAGAAVLIYFAAATRSVRALLLPVLVAYNWIRRKRISLYTVMVVAACAALFQLQESWVGLGKEYLDQLSIDVRAYVHNGLSYAAAWDLFWELGAHTPLGLAVTAVFLLTAVGGMAVKLRTKIVVMDLFYGTSLARLYPTPSADGVGSPEFKELVEFIRARTEEASKLICANSAGAPRMSGAGTRTPYGTISEP